MVGSVPVLLVYPRTGGDRSIQFPVGIAKLGMSVPGGYRPIVIDDRLCDAVEVVDSLVDKAACLGLSTMTGGQLARAAEITQRFRGQIPIVWGGPHASNLPEQCVTEGLADFAAVGDGEPFIAPFLGFISGETAVEDVPGLARVSDDRLVQNPRSYVRELESCLYPCERVLDPGRYVTSRDIFRRCLPLETSRGCPHACAFCHNAIVRGPWRSACATAVADAAHALAEAYQLDGIVFQEDSFFFNRARAETICGLLARAPFRWKANCRISYVVKWGMPFLERLEAGGCGVLQLGVESGSPRTLKRVAKGHTVEQIVEGNRLLAATGIRVRYNFIVGFPWEGISDIEDTVALSERLSAENSGVLDAFFNMYVPYPGTPLCRELEDAGHKLPGSLHEWAGTTWNDADSPWLERTVRDFAAQVSQSHSDRSSYFRGPDGCARD